jgi:hypothetical protein
VSDETWVYGYDHRNQMVSAAYSATDGGSVTQRVTYVYDALGRIERQGWDGNTAATTRYALDGWDSAKPGPIGNEHFDVWAELDGTIALVLRRVAPASTSTSLARPPRARTPPAAVRS